MTGQTEHYEAIVIGAGVAGIYQIKRLNDMGVHATVLEAAGGLGGTWYNNRYPGARFDSESYTYGFSFSKEVLDEWHWKERYSPQPENLKYLEFVADKFDLRKDMQFNCHVDSAHFGYEENVWNLVVNGLRRVSCRWLIMGVGLLPIPTMPRLDGIDDFKGDSFHTFSWPHEGYDLTGKKVGIIGTGATAIQVIGDIADKVDSLHVFQGRANWAAPLNNSKITEEQMAEIRSRYDQIFEVCTRTPGGFEYEPDRRGFYEVSREEREKLWHKLYKEPGFGIWLANFREIFMDEKANEELPEWIADRIRERVKDPGTAEKLIPRDRGFGVQRVPLETYYYEAYNRDNVHLVDMNEEKLVRVTENGLQTEASKYDFDVIIYATGFDAITGAYDRIDIRGANGAMLRDKWETRITTYLGMFIEGFPNLIMPNGPQSGSASTNYPRGIEIGVDWASNFLEYVRANGHTRVEPASDAAERWTKHVEQMYSVMLMRKAKSWFTGYNSNVKGHEAGTIRYLVYNGGTPKLVSIVNQVAADGYSGIVFDGDPSGGAKGTAEFTRRAAE